MSDHANVVAPAPVFFVAGVAVGFLLQFALPSTLLSFGYSRVLGVVVFAASVALVVSAVVHLNRSKTAFDARKSTTSIVTTGAFQISRNPTYLSLALFQMAIALYFQSVWVLVTLIGSVSITHWGVILREEQYLLQKFGSTYTNYSARVRSWL